MQAYPEDYLSEVVENQGKLFDLVAQEYPDRDREVLIEPYMGGQTRKNMD